MSFKVPKYLSLFFFIIGGHGAGLALQAQSSFQVEQHSYQRTWPNNCNPKISADDCSYVLFEYQTLLSAPNPDLVDKVNRLIYQLLADDKNASSKAGMEGLAEAFIELKSSPEYRGSSTWFKETQVELSQKSKVLSVYFSTTGYEGGAHPYGFFQHHHFNLHTGQKVELGDLFKPDYLPALLVIGEKNFREENNIKAHEKFSDYGYEFPNGRFALSQYYILGENSISFEYDRYEIGPYIVPPSSFVVSYEEIAHLLKENNLLGVPTRSAGRRFGPAQSSCHFTFVGTLAKKSITMCFYPDQNNGKVSGHYYYGDGSAGVLAFEGRAVRQPDGSYLQRLEERNNQGTVTGFFIGKLKSGQMQGTWSSRDGSRSFPYRLTLQR